MASSAPTRYRLHYFNGRGRAEQIRWILIHSGTRWEDRRIMREDWPALKASTPVGSLPYLDAGQVKVGTSGAVAMFLARELDLAGVNALEEAEVQMIWEATQDVFNAFAKTAFAPKNKQEGLLKEYATVAVPRYIKLISKQLEGGKTWLVGDKLSMADLVCACFLDNQHGAVKEGINAVQETSALLNRVRELPNIKKWIANRPATEF